MNRRPSSPARRAIRSDSVMPTRHVPACAMSMPASSSGPNSADDVRISAPAIEIGESAGEPPVVVDQLWHEGRLDEEEVELLEAPDAVEGRLRAGPAVAHVERQCEVGPGVRSHRPHELDDLVVILGRVGERLDLGRTEAILLCAIDELVRVANRRRERTRPAVHRQIGHDRLGPLCAEQLPDRHAVRLPREIPERHVDAGERDPPEPDSGRPDGAVAERRPQRSGRRHPLPCRMSATPRLHENEVGSSMNAFTTGGETARLADADESVLRCDAHDRRLVRLVGGATRHGAGVLRTTASTLTMFIDVPSRDRGITE